MQILREFVIFIVCAISVFLLCYIINTVEVKTRADVDAEREKTKSVSPDVECFQYKEWNSHRYVFYVDIFMSGMTHDPACPECLNKK